MIYLNNAATTWPKPEEVYLAADRTFRQMCSPLRASAREDCDTFPMLEEARKDVAAFLGAADPERVIFTPGCTYSLNLAILGLPWERDDVAIMSGLEHHAVSRPIRKAARERGIRFEIAPYRPGQPIDLDFLETKLRAGRVRLVACTMASNVTGELFPVREVARLAHAHGALCLVDAAQGAGVVPLDVAELGADLLACAGHKGLFGPPGVGVLYIAKGVQLNTLAEGGTGKDSGKHVMSLAHTAAYEVGTHNLPSIAGLAAGVRWLKSRGVASIREHERALVARFLEGLKGLRGVKVYGAPDASARTGVVSITMAGRTPRDLGRWLADEKNIVTRAGYHCAPLAHETIGTLPGDGTLRFGVGAFNTEEDIDRALSALAEVQA